MAESAFGGHVTQGWGGGGGLRVPLGAMSPGDGWVGADNAFGGHSPGDGRGVAESALGAMSPGDGGEEGGG